MKRHLIPIILSAALCLSSCFAADRPNIILIFTDDQHPEIVQRLKASLTGWAADLKPAGLPDGKGNAQEQSFYQHYFGHPKP